MTTVITGKLPKRFKIRATSICHGLTIKAFITIVLILICLGINAQVPDQMATLVRKLTDHIISQTDYQLKDQNGKMYAQSKNAAIGSQLKAGSKYNKWMYVNGGYGYWHGSSGRRPA